MVYVIENIVFFLQHDHLGITDFLPENSTVMKYFIDYAERWFSRGWIQMEEIFGEAYRNVRENRSNQGINHISKISISDITVIFNTSRKVDTIKGSLRNGGSPKFFVIHTVVRLSSADLMAAIDTTSEPSQQRCGANVDEGNDLIRGELRPKQRNQSKIKSVPHGQKTGR